MREKIDNIFQNISIVVPNLNSRDDLKQLVQSLKIQTYKSWQLVIIDGNSDQKDINYIESISINDKRIQYFSQGKEYKGIFGAMNQGLKYTLKDNWIVFWGSDDWLEDKYKLEKLFLEIKNLEKKTDIITCKVNYVSKSNKLIRKSFFSFKERFFNRNEYFVKTLFGDIPPHQGAVLSPRLVKKGNIFNDKYRIASDLDFFISLSSAKDLYVKSSKINLLNLSPGGLSERKFLLKFKEVVFIYMKQFSVFFFIPIIIRYIRRYILNKD